MQAVSVGRGRPATPPPLTGARRLLDPPTGASGTPEPLVGGWQPPKGRADPERLALTRRRPSEKCRLAPARLVGLTQGHVGASAAKH
eukprot:2215439-Alexandrium_andersonii.AAC.1